MSSIDGWEGGLKWADTIVVGDYSGLTIKVWLESLHKASTWRFPHKNFVCVMGLVITMLSVTGVYIWWKKHRAANARSNKMIAAANTAGLNH
jgi:uncharacterized iron-regulated membrane protein